MSKRISELQQQVDNYATLIEDLRQKVDELKTKIVECEVRHQHQLHLISANQALTNYWEGLAIRLSAEKARHKCSSCPLGCCKPGVK